ncbi:DUF3617 family protein [uncultured Lamprocystis sp.]|jgi:hypothetical protein|uniref:DUF3617 family protein n=1 Tax=uncultured Lamprocystis sp. TaxID=543132 RepID=UPI0025E30A13|nr:DUF3617 family protein [uncultured Lamprocystis sp.]
MTHVFTAGLLALLAWGQANAEPLKAKPGLWETTTVTEIKRAKAPTNLDQLSPEQRAKVEDKLAQQVKRETRVTKSCLKQGQIDSAEAFTGGSHYGACTRTFASQTASEQVARIECAGANPLVGTVQIRAVDPEHIAGSIEIAYGPADRMQMSTLSELTSRWLADDCATK